MRDFRTSDREVAKRRDRARDGASRRSVRNPEEAKGPRNGGEAGRSPGSRGRGDWRPLVGRLLGRSETARLTRRTKTSHSPFAQRTPKPHRPANETFSAPFAQRASKPHRLASAFSQPIRAADASGETLVCNLSFLYMDWFCLVAGGLRLAAGTGCVEVTSGWSGIKHGFIWLWGDIEQVTPARRW